MFDDPVDSSLIYAIIGLILFVALLGLLILLSTSCCCFYCFVYSASTCLCCCYHHRRRYSLNKEPTTGQRRQRVRLRRRASDLTDFSQLYDSCPHLLNSKAMLSNSSITFVSSSALNSNSLSIFFFFVSMFFPSFVRCAILFHSRVPFFEYLRNSASDLRNASLGAAFASSGVLPARTFLCSAEELGLDATNDDFDTIER